MYGKDRSFAFGVYTTLLSLEDWFLRFRLALDVDE